ncbi:MAG: response regulator [Anaerolineae bacterium]|nr:response regulator [Anaerolineae bacterium]
MKKIQSGTAIPRHFVFIMVDGAFVVQLGDNRGQDLLSGHFHTLSDDQYGHAITDHELNQLKSAGRVEHFNRNYVWLTALPEPHVYEQRTTQERLPNRVRLYYINTTLPTTKLNVVHGMLAGLGLTDDVMATDRSDLVAIVGKNEKPFAELKEAENIQKELANRAPHLFDKAVIAFVESRRDIDGLPDIAPAIGNPDLTTLIASQTDTLLTTNKQVVLLLNQSDEREVVHELCREMKMNVRLAETGTDALHLLEDGHSDLLLMDLQLPDMHGWAMLAKVKEIDELRELPIIVIADYSMSSQQSLALAVAKVDVYLVRPVSRALLRQNIWLALKDRSKM